MHPTPISHGPRDRTRESFASRALPVLPAAGAGAPAAVAARSQRLLVQWSLLLCPNQKKGRTS